MSLRARLLLAVGAVAVAALLVADIATYSALRSFLYDRVDQSLETAMDGVLRRGGGPGGPGGPDARPGPGSATYIERRFPTGRTVQFPGYRPGGQAFAPELPDDLSSDEVIRNISADGARARVAQLGDGGQMIVALPLDDARATLRRLLGVEILVTLGALGAAAALGWSLVRVGLRPLAEIEETAEAIAAGDLDRRVPGDDAPTEVGRLARVLNTMLGKIQDAFHARDATEARLRRFVADASHELRTPVAAVGAYAELFERGANERPDDLDRVMAGIRTESQRMGELVNDLLLLARLDEGRPLEREDVDLVEVAREAVEAASAVGPDWPVDLNAAGQVEVIGDGARLRQVFDNLLSNVRAHTPTGTTANVVVGLEDGHAVIAVRDSGPGLDEEQRQHVFERFYRGEASRTRAEGGGGAGLGLSIVSAIVAAHGGSVSVDSPDGGGTRFTVRLPAST